MIDYTRGFILYLIQHARRPLTKVTLLKLVYLADVEHCRRTGTQLTALHWWRDNFGRVDYAVLRHAKDLASSGHITIGKDGPSHTYRPVPNVRMEIDDEWREHGDFVVREYSAWDRKRIVSVVYATEPMQPDPSVGEELDLSRVKRHPIFTATEREHVLRTVVTSQAYERITVPENLAAQWLDEVLAGQRPEIP